MEAADAVAIGQPVAPSGEQTDSLTHSPPTAIPLPSIEPSVNTVNASNRAGSPSSNGSKPRLLNSSISSRQHSPALSSITTLTSISATPPPPTLNGIDRSGPPPAKRRKLTEAEKIQRRVDKNQKEEERAIEKARREEEKLRKDEERRVKNEEREEKKRERDILKQQKEVEKQQKQEEKDEKKREKEEEQRRKQEEIDKKQRAQSRINSFFMKPTTPAKPKADAAPLMSNKSPAPADLSGPGNPATPSKIDAATVLSDYEKEFPPLPAAPNTTWAPYNSFSWDDGARAYAEKRVSECLVAKYTSDNSLPSLIETLDVMRGFKSETDSPLPSVKGLVSSIHGTSLNPIDLTFDLSNQQAGERTLAKVPLKYVFFSKDVRPPYIGTNTALRSTKAVSKLARRPFRRSHDDLDYDYDSEAEWEEPEEGEDLDSENESVAESADEDDLDGFLDDEDDPQAQKQRVLAGAVIEPVCSGFFWATGSKPARNCEAYSRLRHYKMEIIKDGLQVPIDPFSTSYWEEEEGLSANARDTSHQATGKASRDPLKALPNSLTNAGNQLGALGALGKSKPTKTSKKAGGIMVGAELEAFKQAVSGSDLSKIGLLAVLKKQFPKTTNDMLKDTLEAVAARVGTKNVDKKWVLTEEGSGA